jgi:hypothetical protein
MRKGNDRLTGVLEIVPLAMPEKTEDMWGMKSFFFHSEDLWSCPRSACIEESIDTDTYHWYVWTLSLWICCTRSCLHLLPNSTARALLFFLLGLWSALVLSSIPPQTHDSMQPHCFWYSFQVGLKTGFFWYLTVLSQRLWLLLVPNSTLSKILAFAGTWQGSLIVF